MSESESTQSKWIFETTDETFEQDVIERSKTVPVVVDFWADWCQPCRMLAPLLEKLVDSYEGRIVLVKANTEKTPVAASRYSVQSIPAVYAVRNGEPVDAFLGLLPEPQLQAWLDRILPSRAEELITEARQLVDQDSETAEAKLREAISLEVRAIEPVVELAKLLFNQNRADECREVIDNLEKQYGYLDPEAEKIKAALELARQGAEAGDVQSCRDAAAAEPKDLSLQLRLVEALAAQQQYEEALNTALSLVRADRHGVGEDARKLMVDMFCLLPDDSDLTRDYRRQLSTALY